MDINGARKKITDESQKIGSSLAVFVEEHLNDFCTTDEAASLITAKGKSISGCIKEITEAARKKAANGVACFSEDEVLQIVDSYYDLENLERKKAETQRDDEVIDIFDLL